MITLRAHHSHYENDNTLYTPRSPTLDLSDAPIVTAAGAQLTSPYPTHRPHLCSSRHSQCIPSMLSDIESKIVRPKYSEAVPTLRLRAVHFSGLPSRATASFGHFRYQTVRQSTGPQARNPHWCGTV